MFEINNKKLCENCFSEVKDGICGNCGYSPENAAEDHTVLPLGTKLDNKIIIGRVMGKGGFGITYLGYDIRMDKVIAVKEYYPNGIAYRSNSGTEVLLADPKSAEAFSKGAEKFYSEAEMVAQFNGNPNIVSVYDFFRANNTVYLVMEFINGITLKNYIRLHGNISDGQALYIMDKMASALSITHSAGVLHRDISPDNIMICKDKKIKLIDFGAARQIFAESSSNLTVVLKPGYTPVEQYTKKGIQGAWTDIYALGASIYYALTGVVLDDPYERMESDDEFSSNKRKINTSLWNILKKCTMINASDRYGSAIELRKALSAVNAPLKPEPLTLSPEDTGNITAETPSQAEDTAAKDVSKEEITEAPERKDDVKTEDNSEETVNITDDLPVDSEGYDPQVNVYKKKSGKKNGKLIAGICTAAAAVIAAAAGAVIAGRGNNDAPIVETSESTSAAVTETETEAKTETETETETSRREVMTTYSSEELDGTHERIIELDSSYPGDRKKGKNSIYKSSLYIFDGDMKFTLALEFVDSEQDSDGGYKRMLRLRDGEEFIDIDVIGKESDSEGWYEVSDNEFSFILPYESYKNIKGRISFEVLNLYVKSAYVEDAGNEDSENKNTENVRAESKTITLDSEYPGFWGKGTDIPKSELTAFGGDVEITLDISADDYDVEPENGTYFYNIKTMDPDNGWAAVHVFEAKKDGEQVEPRGYSGSDDSVYDVDKDTKSFSFRIARGDIEALGDSGLGFQVCNVTITSAELKAAES